MGAKQLFYDLWKTGLDKAYVAAVLVHCPKPLIFFFQITLIYASYGFTNITYELMESYLSEHEQQIRLGNVVSNSAEKFLKVQF